MGAAPDGDAPARRRRFRYRASRALLATLAAATAVLAAGLLVRDRLSAGFLSTNLDKLRMVELALPLVREYPWVGLGRGAFASVFPAYFAAPNHTVYSHPENLVVQWVAEWGLPTAVVGLAGLGWLLRPWRAGFTQSAAALGLGAGLLALTVQNLADLSLEVPAFQYLAAGAVGAVFRSSGGRTPRALRVAAVAVPLLALGTWGVVAALRPPTLHADQQAVHVAWATLDRASVDARRSLREALRGAMGRHPAEPYFPRVGATLAVEARDQPAMPWIQRALERGPNSGRTHFLLAAVLARAGARTQALLELQLAVTYDPALAGRAATVALAVARDPADVRRAVPDGEAGVASLVALARALPAGEGPLRRELAADAVGRSPTNPAPALLLAEWLAQALEAGDTDCAGDLARGCLQRGLALVDDGAERLRREPRRVELLGQLLVAAGEPLRALDRLAVLCPPLEDSRKCVQVWGRAAFAVSDPARREQAIGAIEREACTSRARCAEAYTTLAVTAAAAGDEPAALRYADRALREEPSPARKRALAALERHAPGVAPAPPALPAATAATGADGSDGGVPPPPPARPREPLLPPD